MTANFYRILACLGLLVGLSGCGRATYSFTSQPAYSADPIAALTAFAGSPVALGEPAKAPTPNTEVDVTGLARHARHRRQTRHFQTDKELAEPLATAHATAALPYLRARQVAHRPRNTAASSSGALDSLAIAAIFYTLFLLALLGGAIVLLVKLIRHFVNHSSRQLTSPAAPSATP